MNIERLCGKTARKFKSGEVIIQQGNKADHVYYLKKGICYRSKVYESGAETIGGLKKASSDLNSIIGLLTVLLNILFVIPFFRIVLDIPFTTCFIIPWL